MAAVPTANRIARFEEQIRALTEQHRQLSDEPLRLAIAFDPGSDSQDAHLFEVAENFGGNEVSVDCELFSVAFGGSDGFRLPDGAKLQLVLTNPVELQCAIDEGWETLAPIRQAVQRGDFVEFYCDETGRGFLEQLHG